MRIEICSLPAYASWGGVTHRNEKLLEPLVGLRFGGVSLSANETEYIVRREEVQKAVQETCDMPRLRALLDLWKGTTLRSEIRLPVACARELIS